MPLFDFICRACGLEFEFLVMGGDRPFCPSCASDDLQKQMSSFSSPAKGKGDSGSGSSGCGGCAGGSCSTCK
ncbi:MAG: zinc ribbon domain-containing protein [Desulfobulbaceae bacterium]|nr:zinc ribbon domain-containing protein [Desulfobulbaceae bacterium]